MNIFTEKYLNENLMGPNCILLLKELTQNLGLKKGMRVLDLGCGKGLTSMYLAQTFGVQVYATDLWVSATENYERFKAFGLEELMVPIHAEAHDLPYADEFFDAIISVDSYHYFGRDEGYLSQKLAPLVKKGGAIAFAFPGMKAELTDDIPPELLVFWTKEDLETMHSCGWWEKLLSESDNVKIDHIGEMSCHDQAWADWLKCDNDYARGDQRAMDAGAGKHLNSIAVTMTKL